MAELQCVLFVPLYPFHRHHDEGEYENLFAWETAEVKDGCGTDMAEVVAGLCGAFCTEDDPSDEYEEEGGEHLHGFLCRGYESALCHLPCVFSVAAEQHEWEEEACVIGSP